MITITEITPLPATAEEVWRFFYEMDEHYREWHPEHLQWRTLFGEPLEPGTIWFADEWVGPLRISSRFRVVEAEPRRFFSYRIGFPSSLVRAGGSFRLRPTGENTCELIEKAHFGFKVPLLGWVLDRLLALFLPINEFRRHVREEGENLAALFSRGPASTEGTAAAEIGQQ